MSILSVSEPFIRRLIATLLLGVAVSPRHRAAAQDVQPVSMPLNRRCRATCGYGLFAVTGLQ